MGMSFVAPLNDSLEPQNLVVPDIAQWGDPIVSIIAPVDATVAFNSNNLTGGAAVPGTADYVLYTLTGESGNVEVSSDRPFTYSMTSASGAKGAAAFHVGFPNSYAVKDSATTQPEVGTLRYSVGQLSSVAS